MQFSAGGNSSMQRPLKRVLCVVGVLMVAAVGAAAAGAKPDRAQSVTLTLMTSTGTYVPATQIMVDNFMRVYPNIHVQIESQPAQDLGALYETEFRAGNGPDIFFAEPGHGSTYAIQPIAKQGWALDLSGQPWRKRVPQQMLVGRMLGKALYSEPLGVAVFGMLYNVDLMNQLSVTVPTTFNDLLAACRKISAAGKIPIAWDPGDGGGGIRLSTMLAADDVYADDPGWNAKRDHGQATFANSDWVKVPEQVVQMQQANCFSPGVVGTSLAIAQGQIASGAAVMLPTSTLDLTSIPALNPNLNLAFFAVPGSTPAETRTVLSTSAGYSVNASLKGAEKAAALDFINFIGRPEQAETFARAAHLIDAPDLKAGIVPSYVATPLKAVAPILQRDNPVSMTYLWPNALVFSALDQGMAGVLTGQLTPQQVVSNMDNAFDGNGG